MREVLEITSCCQPLLQENPGQSTCQPLFSHRSCWDKRTAAYLRSNMEISGSLWNKQRPPLNFASVRKRSVGCLIVLQSMRINIAIQHAR